MGDEINEADYWAAIDRALQWIQQKPHSVGAEALTTLLANVWDTIVPANAGEIMQMLNDERREIALDLLIGRSQHGRPIQHPRHIFQPDESERHSN